VSNSIGGTRIGIPAALRLFDPFTQIVEAEGEVMLPDRHALHSTVPNGMESSMISKVEVERFSLISSRPFDVVLAAINDAIGHPDMAEFWKSTHRTRTVAELESTIQKVLERTGLMSFVQFDHGAIVRKELAVRHPE
jgi:hypothetical protein